MYRGWKNSVYHHDVILPLWQCESKYQHQNYAENRWQTVKRYTNRVMDRSGCPPYIWFLALSYVIFCLNNCVDPNLADGTKSPLQVAKFSMTDISPLLYFYFWEPVYFLMDESKQSFPGKSKELRGRWVGISEHIGNKMTYKIITYDTGGEICRSVIRTARDTTMKNLREDPIELDKDLLSVKDILSPADTISAQITSDALNGVQDSYFQKPSTGMMNDDQGSHFQQLPSPTVQSTLAPQATVSPQLKTASPTRISTNKKQRHEHVPKLKDLYPNDPSKGTHRYPKRSTRTVKSGQTLTYSDDTNDNAVDNLPPDPDDDAHDDGAPDDNTNEEQGSHFPQPTGPTAPTVAHQQQFLKNRDVHIDDQPNSFVYLRENGENENPIWK
jgi:hypothetical protein